MIKPTFPSLAKFADFVQLKDYRQPTTDEYVRYVRKLGEHYTCDPATLTEDQLRAYFLFLRQQKKFGGSAMKWWYGALLKEGAGALQDLAAHPKHLGAELGLTALLQTWTRDLRYHPHVHLLGPGGGLTADGWRWRRVPDPQFFLPQDKLAARFKGRLKAWLQAEQPDPWRACPSRCGG